MGQYKKTYYRHGTADTAQTFKNNLMSNILDSSIFDFIFMLLATRMWEKDS